MLAWDITKIPRKATNLEMIIFFSTSQIRQPYSYVIEKMEDNSARRKIIPIYNAIDDGNYKGAIKLCQRKDIQNWDITKVLMAYCLVLTNKHSEGLSLAREVKVKIICCC